MSTLLEPPIVEVKEGCLDMYDSPTWLIEGLVHDGANIISGQPESGKSQLASAIVAAVAHGDKEFLGGKIARKRPGDEGCIVVLTTDAKDEREWQERLLELGIDGSQERRVGIAQYDVSDIDKYRSWARTRAVRLMVVDNLTNVAAAHGVDMNDNSEVAALLQPLTYVANQGTTVIALAHTGKTYQGQAPTNAMGATAFDAWQRQHIHIRPVNEPYVRYLLVSGRRMVQRNISAALEFGGCASSWSLLGEQEDRRPRTDLVHRERVELFEEVANDPDLATVKSKAKIGAYLHERYPDRWTSPDAARKRFDRALKASGGMYHGGRWQAALDDE